MRISIFGLGYVGAVSAACLAKEGHQIVGVDVNRTKADMLAAGHSPIVEPGLDALLKEVTSGADGGGGGALTATTDVERAVTETEISLIFVGTPSRDNGSLDLQYVRRCAQQIGSALKDKDAFHAVVARSTMLPGSVEEIIVPAIESASGKRLGSEFGAAMNPEFLRESTSIHDFYHPSVTVIGADCERTADQVAGIYHFLDAPLVRTDIRTAEMVKYANNSFHGLKVSFANEIGALCKAQGIDSHQVMDIFCRDRKLNLSPYYPSRALPSGDPACPRICAPRPIRPSAWTSKFRCSTRSSPAIESTSNGPSTRSCAAGAGA